MKRIISFLMLLAALLSVASCGRKISFDSDMDKVEKIGFNLVKSSQTEKDLSEATESFNSEIRFEGGKFEVEIIYYANFNKTVEDDYFSCQFIEFDSEEQAENYFNLYVESRLESGEYKLKIYENKIILTNSSEAMKALGGKFK